MNVVVHPTPSPTPYGAGEKDDPGIFPPPWRGKNPQTSFSLPLPEGGGGDG
jgi:hypothetical protein